MQLLLNQLFKLRFAKEILHYIQAIVNRLFILQWKYHPALQQTGSHRTNRFINDIEQTAAAIIHTADKLETTYGKFVHTHILIFFNAG